MAVSDILLIPVLLVVLGGAATGAYVLTFQPTAEEIASEAKILWIQKGVVRSGELNRYGGDGASFDQEWNFAMSYKENNPRMYDLTIYKILEDDAISAIRRKKLTSL